MLFIFCVFFAFALTLSVNGSEDSTNSFHCFKRISSGERLIGYDVTRIIERNSVKGCEDECNIYKCTYFSFGNVGDVNSTCELTTDREISRRQDPNFDLYQKTEECVEGKPTGYEEACYRRVITGKRLHERYIRHSLPCNSLETCQHQCSIEKHFDCQGFNLRLDPARVGRGICELSSIASAHLDLSRDFVYDPEFVYYERDPDNGSPKCGHFNQVPSVTPTYNPEENVIGHHPPTIGGPYYGGDSYGPWSTGYGTVDNGPWGSHGYGSGFYESNNPAAGPPPAFRPHTPIQGSYGYAGGAYGHTGYAGGAYGHTGYAGDAYGHTGYAGGSKGFGGTYGHGGEPQGLGGPYGQRGVSNVYKGGIQGFEGVTYGQGGGVQRFDGSYGQDSVSNGYGAGTQGFGGGTYGYGGGTYGSWGGSNLYGNGYYGYGTGSQTYGNWNSPWSKGPGIFPRPSLPYPTGKYPNYSPKLPGYQGAKPSPTWGPPKYPSGGRRNDKPNRIPTYIIIDADVNRGGYKGGDGNGPNYPPKRPGFGYLPTRPAALPSPPRPLLPQPQPPPGPQPPIRPPPPRVPPLPPMTLPHTFYGPRPPFSLGIPVRGPPDVANREVCFRREHPGYKLNPTSIRGTYETPSVLDCEAMCTNSPFQCTGYSFRYSSSSSGPNCLLTDFTSLNPDIHLLPDRSCDVYFKMSTCMELDRMADTECFLKVAANRKLDPSKLVQSLTVGGMSDCELACLNSGFFTCRSFSFRHGPGVIGEPIENCFLSDWPISALTHLDFVPLPNHEVYERGSYGHGCEFDSGSSHIGPRPPFMPHPNIPQITNAKDPWSVTDTWRHYTVNGWPCRSGTECQLNPEAGFWTCEVEGGDRAQWDYCCRPKHSCGFSRGYNYPWCYVGEAGPDQWRPCSEFYYPEFVNRYSYKPVQAQTPHPVDSYGPPRDTRPWNLGQEGYGSPTYWPISYLYAEPPPNETYWEPEDHYDHLEEHSPVSNHYYLLQEHEDNSPRIKFKPCGHKFPYPRAIVQKLDLKNIPQAGNPGEQFQKDEKPRVPKSEKVPESETELGVFPENKRLKNEMKFLPNATESNVTTKSKEVIKTVEKIIMESTTKAEPEMNETLKKVETKHPREFFSLSLLEEPEFWN